MTTDPTLDALDERGRAAGAAVRAAVADRPVPELDPALVRVRLDDAGDGPGPRRPLVAVVGVAAAVALLIGAALVLRGRGEPESAPADRIGADELARYVLGEVPEGFEPSAVVEPGPGNGPEGLVGAGDVAVYGTDPTRPAVAVGVIPQDAGGPPVVADGLDAVDAGGRPAWDASPWFGSGAVLVEVGDDLVYVLGASAGADTVVTAAGAVAVEDGVARLPEGDLPEGWRFLDTVPAQSLLGGTPLTGFDSPGSADRGGGVVYTRGGVFGPDPGDLGVIRVWSSLGGDLHVHLPALTSEEVEQVTVRDRPGVLARNPEGDGGVEEWALRWEERPGEVVEVVAADTGLTADDVLTLADGLRRAADDDLEVLRRAVLQQDLDHPAMTVVGEGTASDGSLWVLVATPEGDRVRPELRTTAVGGGDGDHAKAFGSSGLGGPGRSGTLFAETAAFHRGGGLAWAYGLVGDEVAAVEARDPRSGDVVGQAEVVAADDVRGWVLELDGRAGGVLVVALDADGAELASVELSW